MYCNTFDVIGNCNEITFSRFSGFRKFLFERNKTEINQIHLGHFYNYFMFSPILYIKNKANYPIEK